MATTANPFTTAIMELESLLHPRLTDGYKIRFWIQVILNSILFILCIIYLIATLIEHRKTGRPLALFRIQRVASGKFMVVNALVLLVIFVGVASILMLALRYKLYTIYYNNGSTIDLLVLTVQEWSPLTLVAWAYSFGNIAAMMQIKTRDYGGPSRGAVVAYNLAFFSTLLIALGLGLPFCMLANARMNTLIRTARSLLPILHTIKAGSLPTAMDLKSILSMQAIILACRRDVSFWARAVLTLAGGIALLTAISAGAAFWFVAFLTRLPENPSTTPGCRSPTSYSRSAEEEEHEITFLGLGDPQDQHENRLHASLNRALHIRVQEGSRAGKAFPPRAISAASASVPPLTPSTPSSSTNVSLKRLSRDLLLSVPVVLLLSLYCFIITILSAVHIGENKGQQWRELTYDGISWSSMVLIFIVASFLHNLLKYRHGAAVTPTRRKSAMSLGGIRLSPSSRKMGTHGGGFYGRFTFKEGKEGRERLNDLEAVESPAMDSGGTRTFEIKAREGSILQTYEQPASPTLEGEEVLDWLELSDLEEKKGIKAI